MARLDLVGQRFGKLEVISYAYTNGGRAFWNCVCDCGNTSIVCTASLRSGNTTSCGCRKKEVAKENIKGQRKKPIPMIGRRFGRLLVLEQTENIGNCSAYRCRCDCRNEIIVRGESLRSGNTKSCGCFAREIRKEIGRQSKGRVSPNAVDLTGERFGRLFVFERADKTAGGKQRWRCLCDCGKETFVTTGHLKSGHSSSCGCLGIERASAAKIKHGLSNTRLWNIWAGIKQRCNNPNQPVFKWYGGKGVKICEEWLEFEAFYDWASSHGYQDGLTIDRIDPDGNYGPNNCRWITRSENSKRVNHKKNT